MMSLIPLFIAALIALSILVLVHEFGHFLMAKIFGVWVEEFGIGLPPRVWGKKYKGTIYSINALPIGGFVRLHGEVAGEKLKKPKRAFVNKPKLVRIIIALGGVFMNFAFAVICLSTSYWFSGIPKGVKVVEVLPDSPAEAAGIKAEDQIIKFNGQSTDNYEDFSEMVAANIGKKVNVEVQRVVGENVQNENLTVVIRSSVPDGEGPLGISFTPNEIYYPAFWQRPFVYTYYGFLKTLDVSQKVVSGFGVIFGQLFLGKIPKGVAGPVGITALLAEIASMGILPLIEFSGIISVNLAILNLVPFPPLDGSRVIFICLEALVGKKILVKVENSIHMVGMALLLLLLIALTANEIPKLFSSGSLSKFVDSIIQ
jgi:regulator of sigma E protease